MRRWIAIQEVNRLHSADLQRDRFCTEKVLPFTLECCDT